MKPATLKPTRIPAALLLVACAVLAACSPVPQSINGQTMGTTYSVKYFGTPDAELDAAVDAKLQALNQSLSTYIETSEISRFNAAPAGEWFEVSPAFVEIVLKAQTISEQSGGAFDITVGPLVNLWGFGATGNRYEPPPADRVQTLLASVGFKNVEIRNEPPALKKTNPDTAIDLSAIAKGYAVDQVAKLLNEAGKSAWLVEVGGELRAQGNKPDGAPWRVAIEKPVAGERSVQRVIELGNAAIATSGDYRNFFEYQDTRYSHSINPQTGWPVTNGIGAVSVVAADAITADAWATALLVTGETEALALAERYNLAVNLVSSNAKGEITETMSPAFAELLQE